jgi:hypothetical protein
MTTNDTTEMEAFITAYLLYLDGEGPQPDLDDLAAEDRAEAAARVRLLEAVLPTTASDGAFDRIAQQFGFDRAGTRITVSGKKFKAARQRQNLDIKTIAATATAAGAPIRTNDLLNLETKGDMQLDQETVSVLVAILNTTVDAIESDFTDEMNAVHAFLASPRFDELLQEWLAENDYDPVELRREVSGRVLATHLRADDVAEEQLVELVRAILRSFER